VGFSVQGSVFRVQGSGVKYLGLMIQGDIVGASAISRSSPRRRLLHESAHLLGIRWGDAVQWFPVKMGDVTILASDRRSKEALGRRRLARLRSRKRVRSPSTARRFATQYKHKIFGGVCDRSESHGGGAARRGGGALPAGEAHVTRGHLHPPWIHGGLGDEDYGQAGYFRCERRNVNLIHPKPYKDPKFTVRCQRLADANRDGYGSVGRHTKLSP
jgi:hypothetical protein